MKRTLLLTIAMVALSIATFAQWMTVGTGFTATSRGIQNIWAPSASVIWASAYDGSGAGAACQDYTLSTDGGLTWTPSTIAGIAGLSWSMLFALDANTAWAAMYKVSGTTNGGIYKTTDGGVTWTRQATATFSNAASFPDFVYFWNANTGVCLGDPINGNFEVYTTTDGGTTWTQTPNANITPAPVTGEYGYTSDCSAIGDTIWFGTNKSQIYRSVDHGLHFTGVTPTGMGANKNTIPCFKDHLNGFCLKFFVGADTTGLLFHSTDGGSTFTSFTKNGVVLSQDMKFVPGTGNTFTTIGVDGTYTDRLGLTYSFDGGSHWGWDPVLQALQVTAQCWLNDSTGWTGGFNTGTGDGLYKFTAFLANPGANFTSNTTLITPGQQVHFFDATTGQPSSWSWTFTGGTPPTSTLQNPFVTYNSTGTFNVTLKAYNYYGNNTITKTGYIVVVGVGINEHSQAAVTLYPNPASDHMVVKASAEFQEIQVFNTMGQVMMKQMVTGKEVTLNTSNLKSGVYNLRIKFADGYGNIKFIVN